MTFYDGLLFNSVDLNALTDIEIDDVGLEAMPETQLSSHKLARADGAKLFNKEYGSRVIPVKGRIMANSRANFLTARDTLMRYLEPLEATLRVPNGDNPIEFTATVANTVFSDTGGGYGAFTTSFLCSDPFGYDAGHRTIINGTSITAGSSTVSLLEAIGGSYKTPGTFTITVVAVSGGSGKYIDLANELGENIRITRDWVADDQLIINMKAKTCKVNGSNVDYNGTFWDLAVGDDAVTYSDNFTTSRTVSILATYKRRRL